MRQRYGNHQQVSGVTHFESHPDAITVHYGSKSYRYSYNSAGKDVVEKMRKLAASGIGLASFISSQKPPHEK